MTVFRKVKSLLGGYKGIEFPQITEDEFSRIEGDLPTYISLCGALEAVGGGGWEGFGYKESVLRAAGWVEGSDRGFSESPNEACIALNRIRGVIAVTTDPEEIIDRLVE